MASLTNRQHDRLLEAEEQEERDRERARRSQLRGIAIPRPPEGAIARDVYPVPAPLLPEPEPIDLTKGTGPEQDAWAQHQGEEERLRRYAEHDAVEQLDKLRLQALEADAIEQPRLSREPTRPDPRPDWRAGLH